MVHNVCVILKLSWSPFRIQFFSFFLCLQAHPEMIRNPHTPTIRCWYSTPNLNICESKPCLINVQIISIRLFFLSLTNK